MLLGRNDNQKTIQRGEVGCFTASESGCGDWPSNCVTVWYSKDGKTIQKSLKVEADHSVIVDAHGELKNTKYGTLWCDTDGNYHKP